MGCGAAAAAMRRPPLFALKLTTSGLQHAPRAATGAAQRAAIGVAATALAAGAILLLALETCRLLAPAVVC